MPARHVVVDGSNIATEGSSLPTLKQLDEAVREFIRENPDDVVTVVVDATFGHRIPAEERLRFEEAELAGEVVSPPAGAIGRGDAFLLRVADKVGAYVLSNDSFQEFHGDYEWLFDKGRLVGGKPVPGVGWIFTPRTPVRGPKSREAVKEAKRKKRGDTPVGAAESGLDLAAERARARGGERKLQRAIAVAVDEAVEPAKTGRKRRRRTRGGEAPSDPVNEPFTFISFIASNHLGDEVEGTVDEFSSHGAFILVDGARCYLPLSAMGDPAPRSARDALRKGETGRFVVQAYDAMRRGIELAMPGFAKVSGAPTPETVEAEIHRKEELLVDGEASAAPVGRSRRRSPAATAAASSAEPAASGPQSGARRRQKQAPATEAAVPRKGRVAKKVAVPELAGAKASRGARPAGAGDDKGSVTKKSTGAKPAAATGTPEGARPRPVRAKKAAAGRPALAKEPAKKAPSTRRRAAMAAPAVKLAENALAKKVAAKTASTRKPATPPATPKTARSAKVPTAKVPTAKVPTAKVPTAKVPTAKATARKAPAAKAGGRVPTVSNAPTPKKAEPKQVPRKKSAGPSEKAVAAKRAPVTRSPKTNRGVTPTSPAKVGAPAPAPVAVKSAVPAKAPAAAKKRAPAKAQKAAPAKAQKAAPAKAQRGRAAKAT